MDYVYYKHTTEMLREELLNTKPTSPAKIKQLEIAIAAFDKLYRMH